MPTDKLSKLAVEAKPGRTNFTPQQPLLGETEISPQNRDVLLQIASLIRLAESFRLGFVKCNQPVQCRQMAARLKEMLAGEANIISVELNEPVSSLRRAILQALESDESDYVGKRAIMVLGFEQSVPSEGPAPALDELNQSRDNFPKSFSGPVLIWLPDYALTRLAREAPDLWGWRSGVFELAPELRLMASLVNVIMQDVDTDNLSLPLKRERAAALEGLISDYQEVKIGERNGQALAGVLNQLGNLRYLLGEYAEAKRLYENSLKISQELRDKKETLKALGQLGMLAEDMGDLVEARRLFQNGLKISQKHGDKKGISKALHHLGNLAYLAGDLVEARHLYNIRLKISEELGDKRGSSTALHQLGILAQDAGDLFEAHRLYQESLNISQGLGDKRGISKSFHQLGNLAYLAGDLVKARLLYHKSLEIFQELGDKNGISDSLGQLGIQAYATGDLEGARRLIQKSMRISKELGNKSGIAIALKNLSFLEEKEGNIGGALEFVKQAEALFIELRSPIAEQAGKDRERLEKLRDSS
ncbi:MAG: tetratricopeptide repeat protein [Methanotrichaceae archaeon]|nr:tetratricopeptide repeat protein [Methanotrichaceae archaeon]